MWRRRGVPLLFGLAILVVLGWIRVADPYPVQAVRNIAFDGFQRLAPREGGDLFVRIVDVDEASLAEIGQWPWPRDILAELADRLTAMGAAVVVFDVLFPEPDRVSPSRIASTLGAAGADMTNLPDYDQLFAAALARTPSVLGFAPAFGPGALPDAPKARFAVSGGSPNLRVPVMESAVMPIAPLLQAAHGLGSTTLEPGGEVQTVRSLPLVWSNGTALFPALSIEALRVAFGVSTPVVFSDQAGAGIIESINIGGGNGLDIPTTRTGSLLLYYQRTPPDLYISARDLLAPDAANYQSQIAGNIVLIGTSAAGLLDIRGTPLGTNMPGVEIHAQAIQQILENAFLVRADWVAGLEILAFLIIGAAVIAIILASRPLVSLLVGSVLGALVVAGCWIAFRNAGLLIDPTFPLIGGFIVYFAMIFFQYVITDAEKRRIRGAFGYYIAPTLLAEIERDTSCLKLGGETRELTIMFSDVRNFTTLSEGLQPNELVALLNTLFGALGARVTDEYGTIDKFIGDAMMAFWNAPLDVDRHPFRACTAALLMRTTLEELNRTDAFHLRRHGRSLSEIQIGIGISTGQALVGNLGLESRFDYSCVGDTVNIASRVESACKAVGYDIVVVESTRNAASDLAFLEAGSIPLKGKSKRERIHILVGDAELAKSELFAELKRAHAEAMAALRAGTGVDSAIERCLAVATFKDRYLPTFYATMKDRRADFVPDSDILLATADLGLPA